MGKLMKYEIKGSYRFILGVLALVIILTGGIYAYMHRAMEVDSTALGGLFLGLSFMVIFGAMFGTFFYIVNLFKKELYEDRGYLTFTLPLSGKQILGSKLLVSLIWFALIGAIVTIVNAIGIFKLIPAEVWQQFQIKEVFQYVNISTIIYTAISMLFSLVQTLLIIYLSMTLGRLTFKNKQISGIWFIIYLVLNTVIGYGFVKSLGIIPQYLNLSTFSLESAHSVLTNLSGLSIMSGFSTGTFITINNVGNFIINIGGAIYSSLVMIVSFFVTSYLIENKIDL